MPDQKLQTANTHASSAADAPSYSGPVMIDVAGLQLTNADIDLLQNPLVGGLIFFARNFESIDQLTELVAQCRAANPRLLLSVDQEGGRVQRFKTGYTLLPSMQSFLPQFLTNEESTLDLIQDTGGLRAAEILASGRDISFAPGLDVDDCHCKAISDRSFSANADQVVLFAEHFIRGMHDAGMAVTGKHFPGHGGVGGDSHLELPVDTRSFDELCGRDLIPFQRLIEQLDAVMPAHIRFPAIDDQNSVGFSPKWLQQVLRQKLGFDGVIFSDDLSMEGAAKAGGYGDRAQLAIDAGCDMVLACNNRAGAEEVLQRLQGQQFPGAVRLQRMRARQEWTWKKLKSQDRWMQTRERLNQITQ